MTRMRPISGTGARSLMRFVAVGVYSLSGIPNSDVHADPDRARELFQYAATTFGDPDAQYNLAHMYIVGAGGLGQGQNRRHALADAGVLPRATGPRRRCSATCCSSATECSRSGRAG